MKCEIETVKRPGDLVLTGNGTLYLVDENGEHHCDPALRPGMMRERAQRIRARLAA